MCILFVQWVRVYVRRDTNRNVGLTFLFDRHRWGTTTLCSGLVKCPSNFASARHSNSGIDWHVHYLALSLHEQPHLLLRRLPSSVHCSMIFAAYHDSRHGWTILACDIWQLTVTAADVQRWFWRVAEHIRFYAVCTICLLQRLAAILNKASCQA